MEAAVRSLQPDLILHLGDYAKDAEALKKTFPHTPLRAVRGNCDMGTGAPVIENFTVQGLKLILTHGHRYDVKSSYTALYNMGHFAGADLLLFGHTHIPHYEQVGKMHILNPGSVKTQSAALIQLTDGKVHCKHISLPVYASL